MTFTAKHALVIVVIVAVFAFSFVVDDLNEWLYRPATNAPLEKSGAVRSAEEQSPHNSAVSAGAADAATADAAARSTNGAARHQASIANRDGDTQPEPISRAELLAEAPVRPPDRSPAIVGRHDAASPVDRVIDRGVSIAIDRVAEGDAAPAQHRFAQLDLKADDTREAAARALPPAQADKPALGALADVERHDAAGAADAAEKPIAVAVAKEPAKPERPADAELHAQESAHAPAQASLEQPTREPAQEAVQASVPVQASARDSAAPAERQPDQVPVAAPRRDAVADAGVQAEDAADALRQVAALSHQHSEPDRLQEALAPAQAPGHDPAADVGAQIDGADDAPRQMAALSRQHSEPDVLEDGTTHAPLRLRDEALADTPDRDSVADAPVDGGGADTDARSDELANPVDHRLGRPVPLPVRRSILTDSVEVPTVRASARSRRHERASRLSARRKAHDLEPNLEPTQTMPEEAEGDAAPPSRRMRNPRAIDPNVGRRHDAFNELSDPRCAFSVRRRGRSVIYTARCPSEPRRSVGQSADDHDARLVARGRTGNVAASVGVGAGATGSVGADADAAADADVRSDTKRATGDASALPTVTDDGDAVAGGSAAK
jgi:hypothetical protein